VITECNRESFAFHDLAGRKVEARFDGGRITSDGGGLLLREVDRRFGFLDQFAECFTDYRNPLLIEHSVAELVKQRVFALALGYEDLNDHDRLRYDPLLAVMAEKRDPFGNDRLRKRDRGAALAGKSTINRLELSLVGADSRSRYKKIPASAKKIEDFFIDSYLAQHRQPPAEIILDLDATDDPVHGDQLGRFFHGYYGHYCFLPLYIFAGDHPLCAKLRPSNIDAAAGSVKQLDRIVSHIRKAWPKVRITVRGDSGFCRDAIMTWCETHDVDYVLGLAKNPRLTREIADELAQAQRQFEDTSEAARVFKEFDYQTRDSWRRPRRVVAKAEHLAGGANPRFVVTSFSPQRYAAQPLYEQVYCGRGDMENRIKEQQLHLFADRTSTHNLRSNQLRLWFSTVAYILLRAIREFGLSNTPLEKAECGTIRVKLLKIGGVIRSSVRRIFLSLSEAYPWPTLFAAVYNNLQRLRAPPWPC
jgi:hypothetical protein